MSKKLLAAALAAAFLATGGVARAANDGAMTSLPTVDAEDAPVYVWGTSGDVAEVNPSKTIIIGSNSKVKGTNNTAGEEDAKLDSVYTIESGYTLKGSSNSTLTVSGDSENEVSGVLLFAVGEAGVGKLQLTAGDQLIIDDYGTVATADPLGETVPGIGGTITNAGTIRVNAGGTLLTTNTLENSGNLILTGTPGNGEDVQQNPAALFNGGLIENTGYIKMGADVIYTGASSADPRRLIRADAPPSVGIDNSGTLGKYKDPNATPPKGYDLELSVGNAAVLSDLVIGNDTRNIGDVILTGGVEAPPALFIAGSDETAVGAALGNVYAGIKDGAKLYGEVVDAQGANLIVENVAEETIEDGVKIIGTVLMGREVTLNQAGIYAGGIQAYGAGDKNIFERVEFDEETGKFVGDIAGTVNVNAASTLVGVAAQTLNINKSSALYDEFTGNQVSIAAGETFENNAYIDLSTKGGYLTGGGTLDNTGGGLEISNATTIGSGAGSTPSIINMTDSEDAEDLDEGYIVVKDSGGLDKLQSILQVGDDVTVDGEKVARGFGGIEYEGTDINVAVDLGEAGSGDFYWEGDAKGKISQNVNLGGGSLTADGGDKTIGAGVTVTADTVYADTKITNLGTQNAGLVIADDGTYDNSKGTVNIGEDEKLAFGEGSTLNNNGGTLTVDKDADIIFADAENKTFTNAGGSLSLNAETDNALDLVNSISGTNIGGTTIYGEMGDGEGIDLNKATSGSVTIADVQANGNDIDVGKAGLNVTGGAGNNLGSLRAGTLDLGEGAYEDLESTVGDVSLVNATVNGSVTSADGIEAENTTIITGDDGKITSIGDAKFTDSIIDGELDIKGSLDATGTTMSGGGKVSGDFISLNTEATGMKHVTGDYTYGDGKGGTDASAHISMLFHEGKLTVDQDIEITNDGGIGSTFTDKVRSVAGKILINGGTEQEHRFLNGLTTDQQETIIGFGGKVGRAAIAQNLESDVTVNSGSALIVGGYIEDAVPEIPGGGDLNITSTGSITLANGATMEFVADPDNAGQAFVLTAANDAPANALNINSGTEFFANRSIKGQDVLLIADNVWDNMTLDGKALADGQTYQNFLDTQGHSAFGNRGQFYFGGLLDGSDNGTYYTFTDFDLSSEEDKADALAGAGAYMGIGDDIYMTTDTTYDTIGRINKADTESDLISLVGSGNDTGLYVAKVLDGIGGGNNFGTGLKNQPIEAYTGTQFANGHDIAGAIEAVTDTVRSFNRAIVSRAYNLGSLLDSVEYDECGNVIESCGGFKNRIWAGYTGQWDKLDRRGVDKGYKYDAHGLNVGYDHVTSSGVGFGAAFGYSKGNYENRGVLWNDSKIHNYSFGLFASYNHASGFFTTVSGTYTYSKYKMNNMWTRETEAGQTNIDRANFHGDTWSVGGELGYDIKPAQNFTITPTLGLYYYSTRTNRFDTTHRDGMKYSRHTLEMPVEVTAKYDIAVGCDSTLSLIANAGYAYNFHNKGTKISRFFVKDTGDTGFGALGDGRFSKPGRSSWNVGGGAQFRYKNIDFGVNYEYYGRKDFRSHNLNANVGYSF